MISGMQMKYASFLLYTENMTFFMLSEVTTVNSLCKNLRNNIMENVNRERKRTRRWVRTWLEGKCMVPPTLLRELADEDPLSYKTHLRMTVKKFEELLGNVETKISLSLIHI